MLQNPARNKLSWQAIRRLSFRIWRSSMFVAALSTVIRMGAHLLLLPAVLLYLSAEQQTMWWIFVALGNFANLADFGFGQAISRVYSFLWAGATDFQAEGLLLAPQTQGQPNLPGIRTLNCTVRHLYLRLSLLAILILGLAGTGYLFKAIMSTPCHLNLWILWAGYLLAIGFNFASGHWLLACLGINQVRRVHITYLFAGLAYLLVSIALLRLGAGLGAMVAATFTRGFVTWFMSRRTFCAVVSPFGFSVRPDFQMLKRLWPNAKKFGILSIGGYLLANGNILISRYILGVEVTASVGLTNQVGSFLVNFANLWLNVRWPEITMLRVQGRLHEMSQLFARRLIFAIGTFTMSAVAVLLFGDFFLQLIHSKTRLLPLAYLVVYFLYLWQQVLYVQFGMLTFTENVVPFFKIGLYTGVAMMALSMILTPLWGLWGLILAPFIAEMACSAWFTVVRGFQGQPMRVREFLRVGLLGH